MSAHVQNVPNIQQDLFNVINEGRSLQQVAPIAQGDASFAALTGVVALARALHDLAMNPLSFNPARYPAVLTQQLGQNEVAGGRARYYLRILTVRRSDLQSYAEMYPADAEWAQTVMMSTSLATFNLLYMGMTTESTPFLRHAADVASPPQSRLGNIITHFQDRWRIFEWASLSRQIANADDVRTQPIFGDIERNLIASLRGKGVNSASGGPTYNWQPTSTFIERVRGIFISYKAINRRVVLPGPPTPGFLNTITTTIRNTMDATYSIFASREPQWNMVNQIALEEIKQDASNIQMFGGRVLSVLITKDITQEALHGGYAYNSPTAGFAPQLEHHIRALVQPLVRSMAGTITLPRLNLWACTTTHKYTRVALMCLSRYLKNLRPLLVVSHSSNVAHLLQLDLLSTIWPSRQTCDVFVGARHPRLNNHADDSQLGQAEHPRFLEVIGEVCIIKYGPHDADYALHVPERHTGAMRYDPVLSALYCELHLLCKAVYAISVAEMAKNAPPPREGQDPLPWLMTTRAGILTALVESGLAALISEKKAAIRELESRVMGQRVLSAAQRSEAPRASPTGASYLLEGQVSAGQGYNPSELPAPDLYLTPPDLQGLLAMHIVNRSELLEGKNVTTAAPKAPAAGNLRLLQWAVTMDTHYERVGRGIKVAYRPPCPSVLEFGSVEHRNWFLTRPQGVTFHQSARSFGKDPTASLTTAEDWAHYNETRRRVGQTISGRSTNSFDSSITKMWNLAGVTYVRRFSENFQIECQLCGEVELKTTQNAHKCAGTTEETTLANSQDTIWRRHLLYPHDVFDFYSASQKQQLLLEINQKGRLSFKDAVNILDDADVNLRAQLPQSIQDLLKGPTAPASSEASSSTAPPPPSTQQVIPPLGLIFWRKGDEKSSAGQAWIATMAMDRILRHLSRAPFRRYPQGRDIPDDTWAINLKLDVLQHHITDPRINTTPLRTALCATPPPGGGASKRDWKWMSAPATPENTYHLGSLLELPAEAVRYYWLRAREHADRQLWFNLLDWD
ncbi:hypothetical protein BGZ72_001342, partial [Mortierella alpina]